MRNKKFEKYFCFTFEMWIVIRIQRVLLCCFPSRNLILLHWPFVPGHFFTFGTASNMNEKKSSKSHENEILGGPVRRKQCDFEFLFIVSCSFQMVRSTLSLLWLLAGIMSNLDPPTEIHSSGQKMCRGCDLNWCFGIQIEKSMYEALQWVHGRFWLYLERLRWPETRETLLIFLPCYMVRSTLLCRRNTVGHRNFLKISDFGFGDVTLHDFLFWFRICALFCLFVSFYLSFSHFIFTGFSKNASKNDEK